MDWEKAESGEFVVEIGKPLGGLVLRARVSHEAKPTRHMTRWYQWTLFAITDPGQVGAGAHGECAEFIDATEAAEQEAKLWALTIIEDVVSTENGWCGKDTEAVRKDVERCARAILDDIGVAKEKKARNHRNEKHSRQGRCSGYVKRTIGNGS